MATHSSTLAWKIPWTEEPDGLQSMESRRVGHDWATLFSLFTFIHGEGNGNPLQRSCLENPRDGAAWWAAVYGVAQSRTRLKRLSSSSSSKIKSATVCTVSPFKYHEMMGQDAIIFIFWMLSFKPTFSLSPFTFIKRLFSSSLLPQGWCYLCILGYWYFSQQSWFQLMLPPAQCFSWCTLHIS